MAMILLHILQTQDKALYFLPKETRDFLVWNSRCFIMLSLPLFLPLSTFLSVTCVPGKQKHFPSRLFAVFPLLCLFTIEFSTQNTFLFYHLAQFCSYSQTPYKSPFGINHPHTLYLFSQKNKLNVFSHSLEHTIDFVLPLLYYWLTFALKQIDCIFFILFSQFVNFFWGGYLTHTQEAMEVDKIIQTEGFGEQRGPSWYLDI